MIAGRVHTHKKSLSKASSIFKGYHRDWIDNRRSCGTTTSLPNLSGETSFTQVPIARCQKCQNILVLRHMSHVVLEAQYKVPKTDPALGLVWVCVPASRSLP